MPYKLLVTDLDGTLLGPDGRVSPRTAAACQRLQSAGCVVTLATGRMWRATAPVAEALGLEAPLIAYQGALARRRQAAEPLWHDAIPVAAASEILQWLAAQGAVASVCHADELILSEPVAKTMAFFESLGIRPRVAKHLHRELRLAPSRIAVYGSAEETARWEARLQEAFPSGLRIQRAMANLVEVTHPRASKGQAIARLAAMLGIGLDEVVACGDNYNDADMLAAAGLGVATDTAPEEVRRHAGRVVDWANDGLAAFFEELAADLGG